LLEAGDSILDVVEVMHPELMSDATIVRGILSPPSFKRTITNYPHFCLAAIITTPLAAIIMSAVSRVRYFPGM
jgi:hypothetical protein